MIEIVRIGRAGRRSIEELDDGRGRRVERSPEDERRRERDRQLNAEAVRQMALRNRRRGRHAA